MKYPAHIEQHHKAGSLRIRKCCLNARIAWFSMMSKNETWFDYGYGNLKVK
jgi:hypothetical protein